MFTSSIVMAYIDVGTGSMLLQASLAGIFTVAVFSRQLKNWCVLRLKRSKELLTRYGKRNE